MGARCHHKTAAAALGRGGGQIQVSFGEGCGHPLSLPLHLLTPPGRPSPPPASLCWGNTSLPRSGPSSWSLGKFPDLRAYCIHPATPAQWLAPSVRVLLHSGNTPTPTFHPALAPREPWASGPPALVLLAPARQGSALPRPDLRARGPARRLPEATHRGHRPLHHRGAWDGASRLWRSAEILESRFNEEAARVLGSGGPARHPAGVSRARAGRGAGLASLRTPTRRPPCRASSSPASLRGAPPTGQAPCRSATESFP